MKNAVTIIVQLTGIKGMNQLYSIRFGDALADAPDVPKLEEAYTG